MKNLSISIILIFLFGLGAIAQSGPQGIKYQAIARDLNGEILVNKEISLQVELYSNNELITKYFSETHEAITNQFGLFSLVIGEGISNSGVFNKIPWDIENIWMEIAIKDDDKSNYSPISNSKLLAVPYAFHAASASRLSEEIINIGNGQVTVKAELEETDQKNYDAYPLRVEGGEQGIAIRINGDAPTRDQNWLTFMNEGGESMGRIEGTFGKIREIAVDVVETIIKGPTDGGAWEVVTENRTYDLNSPSDIIDIRNTYFKNSYTEGLRDNVIEQMKSFKDFVVDAAGAGGTACTLGDCDDIIKKIIDLIIGRLKILAYINSGTSSGVAFESGGADYAEWMKKAYPDEKISFGEVVGIKGGQISKRFTEANQFVTITSNPIIVGAMPKKGNEKNFEKVALMGQVPTLVFGKVNVGDYILPSGNGDGTAKSINPADMVASDFSKIIGVAWSDSEDENIFNYINTAVGFNANQMGMMVNNMQVIMNKIQDEIVKLNPEYDPIYFSANGVSSINSLDNNSISLAAQELDNTIALCGCATEVGDNKTNCLIDCWIKDGGRFRDVMKKFMNGTGVFSGANGFKIGDINRNSNIIRDIVKRTKSIDGEDINLVVELIRGQAQEKIKIPVQDFMDKLFEPNGFIDIEKQFEGYPEIKDLLNNIKNLDFEKFNFSVLKDKINSIIDRIQVLSLLLNTED